MGMGNGNEKAVSDMCSLRHAAGFHRLRFPWKWFEIMGFVAHGNIFATRVGVVVLSHTVEPLSFVLKKKC